MRNILLFLLLGSFIFSGCQKEINDENPETPPAESFQPYTKDSHWKYLQTGIYTGESSVRMTDTKKTVDGITYYLLDGDLSGALGTVYLGQKGNNYYLRAESADAGIPGLGALDLTQIYLNDQEAAGYSWDFTGGQYNLFVIKTPGEIIERDLTITVQGNSYSDVIHTQVQLQGEVPVVGTTTVLIFDYYIAKGVGIVKIEITDATSFDVLGTTELTAYEIK